jgi:integrase
VMVMAATGARFSQVARMLVEDVQIDRQRVMVPASRKGSSTKPRPAIAFPVGEDVLATLGSVTSHRRPSDILLPRRDGEPWASASAMTWRWRRILTRCGLPQNITPYTLRSSSIVRMLASGVPVRFVAQLHDTGIVMIERHYARFITDAIETAARRAIVPVVTPPVVQLPDAKVRLVTGS